MKKPHGPATKPSPDATREQRLAEALRANLRRRKGKPGFDREEGKD